MNTIKSDGWSPYIAWILLIPIAAITYLASIRIAPHLVSEVSPNLANELLFEMFKNSTTPRRIAQIQYLLAISLPPMLFAALFIYSNYFFKNAQSFVQRWQHILLHITILTIQVFLLRYGIRLWRIQEKSIYSYIGLTTIDSAIRYGVLTFLTLPIIFRIWPRQNRFPQLNLYVPWTLAVIGTCIQLMSCIYTDYNILDAPAVITGHMDHTYGEFSAILYGKTAFVDFFPQYQNLLPYLSIPIFKIFGLNVFTFTLWMCLLSFLGLIATFSILKQMTKSSWIALLFYYPILIFGFYTTHPQIRTGSPSSFNYFAMWPLRFFWPFLSLWLLCQGNQKSSRTMTRLSILVATLGAINNIDFGIPALVGAIFAFVLINIREYIEFPKKFGLLLADLAVGISIAVFGYLGLTILRSGEFPHLSQAFQFHKVFAILGFVAFNAPGTGIQNLIYGTYLASLILSFYLAWTRSESRLEIKIFSFMGIFGCGSYLYYITRPHPHVLVTYFVPWVFTSMALLAYGLKQLSLFSRSDWLNSYRLLALVPCLFLWVQSFIFLSVYSQFRSPELELQRLSTHDETYLKRKEGMLSFIRSHVTPNEEVSLMMPDAGWYAHEAHVKNVFQYGQLYSLFFKEQGHLLAADYVQKGISKVFMVVGGGPTPYSELRQELKGLGYKEIVAGEFMPNFPLVLYARESASKP